MKNLLAHARQLAAPVLLALAWPVLAQSPGAPSGEAAMPWQALRAETQELMRADAALQRLEGELAQLRQAAGSTRAELGTLRQRIGQAQPWYRSARLEQALALLALATAGALALLAWRTRRFDAALRRDEPSAPEALERQRADTASSAQEVPVRPAIAPPAVQPLVADLAPVAALPPRPGASAPAGGPLRVETLAAILDEAEFLASLGLHAKASDVLESYLAGSATPAPVAFIELMRVCTLAEEARALQAVRRRYAEVHGVPAPTLEQVGAQGGLEQHRALAGRVTQAWGTAGVLPLIEEALFGAPGRDTVLGVEAARELICLHAIAQSLAADGAAGLAVAQEPPLAPWAHAEHLAEAQAFVHAMGDDFGGHPFALDLDLSVAPQPLPEKAPEPDAQELAALLLAGREAARQAAERAAREAEEAFNAAVASERAPFPRR
ncbi:hypothetical protein [Ramlibacter alkalitolerans]|uniref:Uncharacterized protein n=1 Tax=Ramlibacter alkalitolerans TaxID=2039631 RepID=A0ABS1JP49_9BURK|nr:hypothetical protein [Ramlibacter alkalitolerans]MBL0426034.1 hypothetical protein [Ramlibacter alkalitolerans]